MITEREELKVLATNGLKMQNFHSERHLQNHQNNITEAAHKVLIQWRTNQANDKTAYNKLCKALKRANMEYYIEKALKEPHGSGRKRKKTTR